MLHYIGMTDKQWQEILDLLPYGATSRMLMEAKFRTEGLLPSSWISRSYLGKLGYEIKDLSDDRLQALSNVLVEADKLGYSIGYSDVEEIIQSQMEEWNIDRRK